MLFSPTCCPTGVSTSVSRSICSLTRASLCCSLSANISCRAWHPISLQRTVDPGMTCDTMFRSGFLRKSTRSADSLGHMITWTNTPLWISHQPLQLPAHFPHFHWRLTCCTSFWQIRAAVHGFKWDNLIRTYTRWGSLVRTPSLVPHNLDSVQDADPVHQDLDTVQDPNHVHQDPDPVPQDMVHSLGLWSCSQFSEPLSGFEKQIDQAIDC